MNKFEELTFNEVRDFLLDDLMINDDVVDCMCSIHGYTIETLDEVCYWKFGMTCSQMMEELAELEVWYDILSDDGRIS